MTPQTHYHAIENGNWKTSVLLRLLRQVAMSRLLRPLRLIAPFIGLSLLIMTMSKVDLPAPFLLDQANKFTLSGIAAEMMYGRTSVI
jgi:hypothetical protein